MLTLEILQMTLNDIKQKTTVKSKGQPTNRPTNGPTNIAGQSRKECDLKVRTGEHLSNEHLHILTTVKLTALSLQVHVPGEECCFQE